MTPDAAFGFERRGTPATVAELGARDGFEVCRRPAVHSRWRRGPELGHPRRHRARRPCHGRATARPAGDHHRVDRRRGRRSVAPRFPLPIALPPDGDYAVTVDGAPQTLQLVGGDAYLARMSRRISA